MSEEMFIEQWRKYFDDFENYLFINEDSSVYEGAQNKECHIFSHIWLFWIFPRSKIRFKMEYECFLIDCSRLLMDIVHCAHIMAAYPAWSWTVCIILKHTLGWSQNGPNPYSNGKNSNGYIAWDLKGDSKKIVTLYIWIIPSICPQMSTFQFSLQLDGGEGVQSNFGSCLWKTSIIFSFSMSFSRRGLKLASVW